MLRGIWDLPIPGIKPIGRQIPIPGIKPCIGRQILNHWPTREVLRTISGWQFLPRPWAQFRLMPCIVVHISLVSFNLDQLLNFYLGNISISQVFNPVVLENVPLPWFVWYFLMILNMHLGQTCHSSDTGSSVSPTRRDVESVMLTLIAWKKWWPSATILHCTVTSFLPVMNE